MGVEIPWTPDFPCNTSLGVSRELGPNPSYMECVRIVVVCILCSTFYGIVHDLVTAHMCVQYFTVAHPWVFPSEEPVVMALIWGVLATWWVGLILGVLLALAARVGSRPGRTARQILPQVGALLKIMGLCALIAGLLGMTLSHLGFLQLTQKTDRIPPEIWDGFFFDAFAHLASYFVGLVGGLVVVFNTWKLRSKSC